MQVKVRVFFSSTYLLDGYNHLTGEEGSGVKYSDLDLEIGKIEEVYQFLRPVHDALKKSRKIDEEMIKENNKGNYKNVAKLKEKLKRIECQFRIFCYDGMYGYIELPPGSPGYPNGGQLNFTRIHIEGL